MIPRYTRDEMAAIWSLEHKFQRMLDVEKAVARVQANLGLIPKEAADAIEKKGGFKLERIQEIEKTTKHDVIAFVSSVAEHVGPMGRYVHFGLTSSDVLDTAMGLIIRDAYKLLDTGLARLEKTLKALVQKHEGTVCAGRTHGMHAEPTTFGFKMAGYYEELHRNRIRIEKAVEDIQVVKLSGAVGTSSALPLAVEEQVGKILSLKPEPIATQVVPRDRHAQVIFQLALLGAGLERLAVELRHLQRTEVGEALEGFSSGQKGSSAMPHKRNPIGSENVTGLARLLRSYSQAALEDVPLWHERDISHSSVERVIFPDAFILADYALHRMNEICENLEVRSDRMQQNMELSQGQLFSSHILLELVNKGLSREEAYKLTQELSHSLKSGQSLKEALLKDSRHKISPERIAAIFSGSDHRESIGKKLKAWLQSH